MDTVSGCLLPAAADCGVPSRGAPGLGAPGRTPGAPSLTPGAPGLGPGARGPTMRGPGAPGRGAGAPGRGPGGRTAVPLAGLAGDLAALGGATQGQITGQSGNASHSQTHANFRGILVEPEATSGESSWNPRQHHTNF